MSVIGPRFSVVIPNHGRVTPLIRAIQSSLAPSDGGVEVLVVDDASPNLKEIEAAVAALQDDRVRLLRLPAKGNAAAARNFGADHARGEWILLLDSDDVYLSSRLASIERALASGTEADVLYCRARFLCDGKIIGVRPSRSMAVGETISDFLFVRSESLMTSTLAVRADIFREVRFDDRYHRHQDYDFCLRLEQRGARFQYLNEVDTEVYWSITSGPVSKGESPEFSMQWALDHRQAMSQAAFRRFVSRFVVLKNLRLGRRRAALLAMRKHRAYGGPFDIVVSIGLFLSTGRMREIGYSIYKRVVEPTIARMRGTPAGNGPGELYRST
jgi:amylovoran biosynthesis glycosyltransferase AmsB